jgi:predicted dithiol-disulfide oxidoreductase (DUF899 family)
MESSARTELEQVEQQMRELEQKRHQLLRDSCGEAVQDYELSRPDGSKVRLSEFFGDKDKLVLIHNMGQSCPYCTLWAEGFNSIFPYVEQEAGFVLVNADEPAAVKEFAGQRRWKFPIATAIGTSLFTDMGFADDKGGPWPGVSVLIKNDDGSITRYSRDHFGPGDRYSGVFAFLDLLPPRANPEEWFVPDHEAALNR